MNTNHPRTSRSHASVRSRGTQINRGGAPRKNENAKKRLTWVDSFDLSSSEGVRQFLAEIAKATWTGDLGSRAAGALNGTVRLLLEHEVLPQLEARIKVLEDTRGMKTN